MNNVYKILVFGLILGCWSCLDVVEVDLEEATPRLVVDATLQKNIVNNSENQIIKISRTRDFFSDEPVLVEGATVSVTDENGEVFNFQETNPGEYTFNDFQPVFETTYFLEVEVEGQLLTAEETYTEGLEIDVVSQSFGTGFSDDQFQVRAFFTDDGTGNNFYLFKFFTDFLFFPDFTLIDDEFISGNSNSVTFSDEDLVEGETVLIQLHKISRGYYNYLQRLLAQVGAAGGPFQAQPSTVRGNIVNETNPDDFVFGYFSISEYDEVSITIEPEND